MQYNREYDLEREFRFDAEWEIHRMENAFLVDDMLNLLQFHYLLINVRQRLRINPLKGRDVNWLLGHPGLTYIFNF